MMMDRFVRQRLFSAWLLMCGLFAFAGCGGPKMVPVTGKVMLADQPLTVGRINFIPDRAKGNNQSVACIGRPNSQGAYELVTVTVRGESKKGAFPGWYKVTFLNSNEFKEDLQGKVNRKFMDEKSSPFSIEVVENPEPDRYNFTVTK